MQLFDEFYRDCRKKPNSVFDTVYTKRNIHHVSEGWVFLAIIIVIILGASTRYNLRENLPAALGTSDLLHNPSSFIADRAWKDLQIMTSFGPRPVGKYSNEFLAVDFLQREISYIKQSAHVSQLIDMDVQTVSGAFWNGFKPLGMTSVYRNIQNVIVKLHGSPQMKNGSSVLINAHFDTVPGSPGASDDAASCVVMLEILRVLSRAHYRNQHDIIFLFNGAEETGLQGAHGFITQHKWAPSIKAFVNLESVGSGGKELLFQGSPNNSWLLKTYGKAVPHPNAQVAAEEVFQSGIIPSDTDFRIFRDFGQLSGLDFAHHINSYRYHTKYDHIDFLSKSTLQHTGDNMMELLKAIANSPELREKYDKSSSPQVYFDVFGYFFIAYSVDFATIFNYAVVICAVLIPYMTLSRATKGINKKHLRYEIFLGFFINMIILVSSNALCYAIAYDLDVMGKSMSWYNNTFMCIPTYCLVSVFVQSVGHLIFNLNEKVPLSLALQTQARLIGTSFFWGILTAALTGARIRTAYAIIIPLLITLISNVVISILGYQNAVRSWLYIHLTGQVLVVLWTTNFYHMIVEILIPTAGRSGGGKNPDVLIAVVCNSLAFFVTSYLTPLVILFKKRKNFLVSMFAVYIITRFYFIAFTSYGFPYADDTRGQPRVQRHWFTHAVRTLYDKDGHIRYTDSGFWMLDMDRNAHKIIESLTMPEQPIPQQENILCKSEPFCGLPMYSPRQTIPGGFWVPGPMPLVREEGHLKLIEHTKLTSTKHRMSFLLTASHLVSLQIRLKETVTLKNWSFTKKLPPTNFYNKQESYFVLITFGRKVEPINITFEMETGDTQFKRALLDITLVTYHMEYHKEHTSIFASMLAKLPRWTYAIPSVASLKSWTF